MWREMARIVGEVRPRLVFVENSPMLMGRGAALVISDLAQMGYDCQWCIVSASDCGAPHQRDRFWLVGYTNDYGQVTAEVSGGAAQGSDIDKAWQEQASELEGSGQQHKTMADTTSQRQQGQRQSWFWSDPAEKTEGETDQSWAKRVGHIWGVESTVGRVADGVSARVDRLKAIGNGQVPIVAATAFSILRGR
jgi:DNA (cytosine-5)-methyltransferase 1